MSRRTKLLITALFLVLIAIPITYVFLTWAPANPLRFRAVLVPGSSAPVGWRNLELYVENTSLAPVLLIDRAQGPNEGYTLPLQVEPMVSLFGPVRTVERDAVIIPAGRELRLWHFMRESDVRMAEDGQYWMQYACLSRTKMQGLRLFRWLHTQAPIWLIERLPELSMHYECTPMTMPARESPP